MKAGLAIAALLAAGGLSANAGEVGSAETPASSILPATACASPGGTNPAAEPANIRCLLAARRPAQAFLLAQRLFAARPDDAEARALVAAALAALNARPAAAEPYVAQGSGVAALWRSLANAVQGVAWIAVEIGRDSNINSATSLETIPIPLLNYRSLQLDPLLVRRPSGFLGLNAGGVLRKPLSAETAVGAQGIASARVNASETAYLPHNYLGQVSLLRRVGPVELVADLGVSQDWLGRHRVAERTQATGRVKLAPSPGWETDIAVAYAENVYPQFNAVRTTQTKTSAGFAHAPSGLSATLHSGVEMAKGSIRDLDRRFTGFALGWHLPVSANGSLMARVGEVRSRYLVPSALFAGERRDTAREIEIAYSWRLGDNWTLTPRLLAEENQSSIPLVAFKRVQGLVELRRTF
jgi:hypothetical protein